MLNKDVIREQNADSDMDIANCLLKQHPEPVKRSHINERSQQLFGLCENPSVNS